MRLPTGLRAGRGRARHGDRALETGEATAQEALRGQGTPHALGQPGPEALPARMKRSVPVLCTNLAPRTLGP